MIEDIATWDARIHPETYTGPTPYFRTYPDKNGNRDRDIWQSIFVENEYELGCLAPDDIVIDIGAHIGAFSCLAYVKGSRNVLSYEPDLDAFIAAKRNIARIANKFDEKALTIEPHNAAVVGLNQINNTGMINYDTGTMRVGSGDKFAPTTTLDEIIKGRKIRFLKTDCEGYEWPILYTCQSLSLIQEIAGEFHENNDMTIWELYSGRPNDDSRIKVARGNFMANLADHLMESGFQVRYTDPSMKGGLGNFWATRNPENQLLGKVSK